MHPKKFLLLFSIIACTQTNAQIASTRNDFRVTWGAEYEFPKKHEDMGFVRTDNGYLNVSYQDGKSFVIQKFDNKMKFTGEEEVNLESFPSNFMNEGIHRIGDKWYWFYSLWDKPKEKEQLYAQNIDVVTGKLNGTAQKVLESGKLTGDMVSKGFYNIQVANKYTFSPNLNKDLMLISYRYPPLDKDDSRNHDRLGWYVFNSSLEKVWGKDVKMPYTEEQMDNSDLMVDAKGQVYLLARVYEANRKELKKEKKPTYHFEILKPDGQTGEFTKIKLESEGHFINQVLLDDDGSGNLLCTGFYSNVTMKSNAPLFAGAPNMRTTSKMGGSSSDGVFIMKVDPVSGQASVLKKGFYEFPVEVLKQFESARTQKKMEKKDKDDDEGLEETDLNMRKVFMEEDGSILLTAEESFITRSTTTNSKGMQGSTTYTYHYNDIMAIRINKDGELAWMQKIPKKQRGGKGRGGMSFKTYMLNDAYYFLYLDNIKNLNLSQDRAPELHADGAGGFLVYTKLDKEGKMTKGKIMDLREEETTLKPADFIKVDEKQLVIRSFHRKISRIFGLTLNVRATE